MRFLALFLRTCHLACVVGFCLSCMPLSTLAVFTDGSAVLGGANYTSRSASLADYDNDGDLDLMFETNSGAKLFRNNLITSSVVGSLGFTDVTNTMLPVDAGFVDAWSAAWGDYNGDGKIDVFIGASSQTGLLLKNNGATTPFSNANSTTGLNTPLFTSGNSFSQNVAWADFNNDHRLDLVVAMEGPNLHQMYLQNASGTFAQSGTAVGIQQPFGTKSYGLAIGDPDGDGDMDMYISTCSNGNIRNNFYKNTFVESGNQTLHFTDVADTNGTQNTNNTYGTQFIDMNNDGKLDLVVTGADGGTLNTKTKIYVNNQNGTFTDVDTITGHPLLSNVGQDLNGLKVIDYDNDGWLDLYFHDNLSGTGNQKLYHNEGNWNFSDVTATMGLSGLATTGANGYDSTWGDIDRDGDQDLIDTNASTAIINGHSTATPEKVFLNDASANGNHWLYVKLTGPNWNTTGIGASLYATLSDGSLQGITLRREANTDADTFNQSGVPVHFGLGTSSQIEWLKIAWPDGTVQFLYGVSADEYLTVSYSSALPGDFNGDHTVDASDYVLWRKYYGAPFTMDDLNTWRAHFGQTNSPGSGAQSSVPEPAAVVLLAIGASAFISRRRR